MVVLGLLIVASIAGDAWVIAERRRYRAEITRLRESMTDIERRRADQIVAREQNTLRLALALIRRQSRLEPALHLSISLDSSAMYLERDGILLREMPVEIGPERRIGTPPDTVHLAAPRGVRSIARVLADTAAWPVPPWVLADRGLAPDSQARLGAPAIVLDGGTIIYAVPAAGPLSDSTYVLPGSVRARVDDLRAILPNLTPGVRVYFY